MNFFENQKGFDRIVNLKEFTGLKVIYLEPNGFCNSNIEMIKRV